MIVGKAAMWTAGYDPDLVDEARKS